MADKIIKLALTRVSYGGGDRLIWWTWHHYINFETIYLWIETLFLSILKHFICDSKHSLCQPDDSKHSVLQLFCRELKKNHNMRAWRKWSWFSPKWKIIKRNVQHCYFYAPIPLRREGSWEVREAFGLSPRTTSLPVCRPLSKDKSFCAGWLQNVPVKSCHLNLLQIFPFYIFD